MLHLPTSVTRLTEIRTNGRGADRAADRAMDILQYGLAILALAGALLLGSLR